MIVLLVAVGAMLVQQTFATVSKTVIPVLFKAIADDLDFDAELVLLYTWVFACVGVVVMLAAGAFIARYGALRMSQAGCVLMGGGLALAATAAEPTALALVTLGLSAAIISVGATVATPGSSQILARYAPRRWAPLVFSIKQAGVPMGVALASFLAPVLALTLGWRAAALCMGVACVLIAPALEPCRAEFDSDRDPGRRLTFASLGDTFLEVLRTAELRMLAVSAFAFIGLQSIYTNFTVVYLTEEVGYSLAEAGQALAVATVLAAPGRIVWGWVGSTLVAPDRLLVALAIIMAGGAVAMGSYDASWTSFEIMIPLLLVSATALSWHGVLLSEIARIAVAGDAGRMTGGVLAFGTVGQLVFPLFFGLGYLVAGYPGAYVAVALPAMLAAVSLLVSIRARMRLP